MPSTQNATATPSRGQPSWWQRLTQSIAARAENAAYPLRVATFPGQTTTTGTPDPRDAWAQTTGIIQGMNANVISRRQAMEELGGLTDIPKPWHIPLSAFNPWHGLTDPEPLIVDDPHDDGYQRGRSYANTLRPGVIPGPSGGPVIDPAWKPLHTTLTHDPTNDTFKVNTKAPDGWNISHTVAAAAIRSLPRPEERVTLIAEDLWRQQDKRYSRLGPHPVTPPAVAHWTSPVTYTPPDIQTAHSIISGQLKQAATDVERKLLLGELNTS